MIRPRAKKRGTSREKGFSVKLSLAIVISLYVALLGNLDQKIFFVNCNNLLAKPVNGAVSFFLSDIATHF